MTSLPPRHVVRLAPGVEMAFRCIPAGTVRMGSRGYSDREEPVHEVQIPEAFWLGETPVTQAQFAVWARGKRVDHRNWFAGHPDHPAESMDWREANRYCAWMTRTHADDFPKQAPFACLPTEAEWEYACRGGTETEYYNGDGEAAMAQVGWYADNSENRTHPVASWRERHPFGLHDLHGNVWEWCHDVWDESAYREREDGAPDPGLARRQQEWVEGLEAVLESDRPRVLRGGSWFGVAQLCRSTCRFWRRPFEPYKYYGFRVCLVRGRSDQRGGSD